MPFAFRTSLNRFAGALAVASFVACGGPAEFVVGAGGAGGGVSTATVTGAGGQTNATSTSGASSGGGGMMMTGCKTDMDCSVDKTKPACDVPSGACVGCLPMNDTCPMGQWCNPGSQACEVGCTDASDCAMGANLSCDVAKHKCVGCLADVDCMLGSICIAETCVPGCNAQHACQAGLACCGSICFDLQSDVNHCGACDNAACIVPANAEVVCAAGICGMGACQGVFADCNASPADGCEQNTLQDGPCACKPGDTKPCYDGAPGTENVGPCLAGTSTCDASGLFWGACANEVMPVPETCGNGVDDDCNGIVDDSIDLDGDGWATCSGDCNDNPAAGGAYINPGAFEVLGDGVDNDCDPATSDQAPVAACSAGAKFSGVTGSDMAMAMDLCQFTTANPALPMKKWGVIAADQALANSNLAAGTDLSNIQNSQSAVLQDYGNVIVAKKGPTFAGISSGKMRDANDSGYVLPVGGSSFSSAIAFAPNPGGALGTYVAAHAGGLLPGKCGQNSCPVGSGANDSVNVKLTIRVPTNANSFSYDFRFFSGEYQNYQCTSFNDYYLAILTSNAAGIPADHNISFDALNNPVSVNNGFFQACGGNGKNCGNCPAGTGDLSGTGMDSVNGGGTTWLTTDAPVVPGETMVLELMVFDVSDHIYDSLAILDNFRWNVSNAVVGTHQ